MPDDFTIDINLQNNAKSSAQDLNSVVSAIDRVTEAENKHNATATKNARTQIKINLQLLNVLKEIRFLNRNMAVMMSNAQQQSIKQDKAQLDNGKQKIWQLTRMVALYGVIRRATNIVSGAIQKTTSASSYFAQYGYGAVSSASSPFEVLKMANATRMWGGNAGDAAAGLSAIRRLRSQYNIYRNFPLQEALAAMPEMQRVFLSGTEWQGDATQTIKRLRDVYKNSNTPNKKDRLWAILEAAGIPASWGGLITANDETFAGEMEKAEERATKQDELVKRSMEISYKWGLFLEDVKEKIINVIWPAIEPLLTKDWFKNLFAFGDKVLELLGLIVIGSRVLPRWFGKPGGGGGDKDDKPKPPTPGPGTPLLYPWGNGIYKPYPKPKEKTAPRPAPGIPVPSPAYVAPDPWYKRWGHEIMKWGRDLEDFDVTPLMTVPGMQGIPLFLEGLPKLAPLLRALPQLRFLPAGAYNSVMSMPTSTLAGSGDTSVSVGGVNVYVSSASAASPEAIGSAVADSVAEKVIAVWQGIDHGQAMVYNA